MDDIGLLREAREVFARGGNVSQHFKRKNLTQTQQLKVIEYAYDLQSGSYTHAISTEKEVWDNRRQWGARVGNLLGEYGIKSAIEVGVGEASTLRFIVESANQCTQFSGFDISLSRLCYARQFLAPVKRDISLFTGDLGAIPVIDNAYDSVLSNHSLEPNGGREREMLSELLRVTRRYLILIEPDYEAANDEQKTRMDSFGYVRGLREHLNSLGARLLCDKPWDLNLNPVNAASLLIAEKPTGIDWNEKVGQPLASPFSKEQLECRDGYLYSQADGIAFPVINGFPCLLRDQAVVATHLAEDAAAFAEGFEIAA